MNCATSHGSRGHYYYHRVASRLFARPGHPGAKCVCVNKMLTNPYNGVVSFIPITDKSFSYAMKPGPDPDPTKSPTGEAQYAAHWDIRRFDIENNLYGHSGTR